MSGTSAGARKGWATRRRRQKGAKDAVWIFNMTDEQLSRAQVRGDITARQLEEARRAHQRAYEQNEYPYYREKPKTRKRRKR